MARLLGELLAGESTLDLAKQLLTSASQTVMARTVAFLMPLALFAWATTLAAQAVTFSSSGS